MTTKIRWGILSTGKIARKFTEDLKIMDDAEVVAVGSRTLDSAKTFADKFEIPHAYGSYEELVSDPDVDVIYVGTPHAMHADNVRLSLNAGKHVLNEKAFTINAQEAQEIIDLARAKKLFLMEAVWMRFFPLMARLREWLAEEKLGKIHFMSADFGFNFDFNATSRLFDPALGGGALLDLGIYPISLSSMLFGTPTEIQTMVELGEPGIDYKNAMQFRFESGVFASLQSAMVSILSQSATIIGEKGRVTVHKQFWNPDKMTLHLDGQDPVSFEEIRWGNGYTYEAREVMDCIRAGKLESDIMPLDESLSIMQTMDTLRERWGLKYPFEK